VGSRVRRRFTPAFFCFRDSTPTALCSCIVLMLKMLRNNPTGWAVHEGNPLDSREIGLTLEEAFHSIMAHCSYAPVWDKDDNRLRLRFRYMDEPYKGRYVGDTEPGPEIITYEAPLTLGAFVARDQILKRAVAAGLRGWYGVRMTEFILDRMHAEHAAREEARQYGAAAWD